MSSNLSADPNSNTSNQPLIHRLAVDTLHSFPYLPTIPFSKPSQTTASWSETPSPSTALTYLSPSERARVLKYYRPSDAALSLASHLLKHLAVSRLLSLPWSATHITQERHIANGKPFFAPGGLDFNVSHHGHLAAIAATTSASLKVGIDIVQVNVEKDVRDLQRHGGWRAWSSVFADAFSAAEMRRIHGAVSEAEDGGVWRRPGQVEAALRVFYAHWALKEAYIKMTSEAFMATWLQELEFREVRVPVAASEGLVDGSEGSGRWVEGETVRGIEVWLYGERVTDVQVELQAVGAMYMVATASSHKAHVGELRNVNVDADIAQLAKVSSLID